MKPEEAMEVFTETMNDVSIHVSEGNYIDLVVDGNLYEAIRFANEILKNQILKTPNNYHEVKDFNGTVILKRGKCPHCNGEIDSTGVYCKYCGQRINWGESKDNEARCLISESINQSCKQIKLMQQGKLPKKTWEEFKGKLK